jgi:hypothetical protein
MLPPMGASSYSDIMDSLRHRYLEDLRPWLVGFSSREDSTVLASLIVEAVAGSCSNPRLHWARVPQRLPSAWKRIFGERYYPAT